MIDFLTPEGAAVALAVVAPLAALLVLVRRARVVRDVLGLRPPERPEWIVPAAALAAFAGLVGVAAAQPAMTETAARPRTDVEAFFVVDTSRSMLAAEAQGAERRIERAKDVGGGAAERDRRRPGRDRLAHRPRAPAPLPLRQP